MADLKKKFMEMKVADLRSELGSLGLEKTGVKTVLVDRLIKHYEETFRQSVAKEPELEIQEEVDESIDDVCEDGAAGTMGVVVLDGDQGKSEIQSKADPEEPDKESGAIESDKSNANNDYHNTEETIEEVMDTVADATGGEEELDKEKSDDEDKEEGDGGDVNNEACDEVTEADESQNKENTEGKVSQDSKEDVIQINQKNEEVQGGLASSTPPADSQEGAESCHAEVDTTSQAEPQLDSSNMSASSNFEAENRNAFQAPPEKLDENKRKERVKEAERERLTILVTGLSPDTTANDLKSFFRHFGKIGRIKIMTNTRVPGSQRFAHVCASNMEDLHYFIEKLNGMALNGKTIRLTKAPGDGSVSESYKIAVATELEEANSRKTQDEGSGGGKIGNTDSNPDYSNAKCKSDPNDADSSSDIQVIQESSSSVANKNDNGQESEKKSDSLEKGGNTTSKENAATTEKKAHEKGSRDGHKSPHRPRPSHDRIRKDEHVRPNYNQRSPRQFRRGGGRDAGDYRRHHSPRPIEKIHRDRPPMGRGQSHNTDRIGRRRSPHAQLTFDQIREIREEQRRRDVERRKREEERERAAELERQKRLEYQNYMEFKTLEREREKLRLERERIEREKLELIKLERERQKAERIRIEKEKEELRRAKMNIEHSHRSTAVKRSYEEDPIERRRSDDERKKSYPASERVRIDGVKTEAERKMDKERYERVAISASAGRSRSPGREMAGIRESRRDVWARDARVGPDRNRSERTYRTDSASDRRGREAPSRATGAAETSSRYGMESAHSSGRGSGVSSKRSSDRYEEPRSRREAEWIQRSSYLPTSSSSLPLTASSPGTRDSWPLNDRKIEAWDTARLQPRTEPWISGAVSSGVAGRSSLPAIPAPPIYSHGAVSLNLQSTGLGGLGSYPSTSDRYDGYKGAFDHLRRF